MRRSTRTKPAAAVSKEVVATPAQHQQETNSRGQQQPAGRTGLPRAAKSTQQRSKKRLLVQQPAVNSDDDSLEMEGLEDSDCCGTDASGEDELADAVLGSLEDLDTDEEEQPLLRGIGKGDKASAR